MKLEGDIVSEKGTYFIGKRHPKGNKKGGQIAFISDGLTLPDIFRKKDEGVIVLVDYAPVIDAILEVHKKYYGRRVLEKYNHIINFWWDAKSYTDDDTKKRLYLELFSEASKFINSLILEVQSLKRNYFDSKNQKKKETIDEIVYHSLQYIDVMLCYIHCKASVDIKSFKNSVVLIKNCEDLREHILGLYRYVLTCFESDRFLRNESMLCYLAFMKPEEVESYTRLLPEFDWEKDLRLQILESNPPKREYSNVYKFEFSFYEPDWTHLEAAEKLRDTLYKIDEVLNLLYCLKEEDVEWDSSHEAVEELKHLIKIEKVK